MPSGSSSGWIDDKRPLGALQTALDETGLTPADPGFYAAARASVIDMGIVRRRKVDVVADIPARRVADLPVELDDAAARSIRSAEAALSLRAWSPNTRRSWRREARARMPMRSIWRSCAGWRRRNSRTRVRRPRARTCSRWFASIGQAKAGLAADYAAQLARNVGKVVFFAKHIDVLDQAEELFAARGIGFASIRGDQTSKVREKNIAAFINDPDVEIAVCSLLTAGVGLNLQVASNLVLAELSWTYAEQTQAIDRIHRIGQAKPVTAWRIIAAQTIDSSIAELIDSKSALSARALDGAAGRGSRLVHGHPARGARATADGRARAIAARR